jgi:hypothetical protein
LNSKTGVLEEQDYINLVARSKSTFADQRQLVYQIFTCYQKKKREYQDYDSADRLDLVLLLYHPSPTIVDRSRVIFQSVKKTLRYKDRIDYL